MKKYYLLVSILIILINLSIYSNVIIKTKKIAKIGDEIILDIDIKKHSKLYNIEYNIAKNELIEMAILYTAAKTFTEAPTEEQVDNQIKKDKAYYGSLVGKELRYVTDEEFLASLNYNAYSLTSYRNDLRKKIWVQKYLDKKFQEEILDPYKPSNIEINNLLKNKPELFEEQQGVLLSMIYFSYFNDYRQFLNKQEIEEIKKQSQLCISELKRNTSYESLVEKYSGDLISKNNTPKGRVGFIAFDDPRVTAHFSKEIIDDLKKSEVGIIHKVYETQNGLYIFKIDERIMPRKLNNNEAKIKAETYLEKENEKKIKQNLKKKIIDELKKEIKIEYF